MNELEIKSKCDNINRFLEIKQNQIQDTKNPVNKINLKKEMYDRVLYCFKTHKYRYNSNHLNELYKKLLDFDLNLFKHNKNLYDRLWKDWFINTVNVLNYLINAEKFFILPHMKNWNIIYYDQISSYTDKYSDTCAICLNEFNEGMPIVTHNNIHLFHPECINEWYWIQNIQKCPIDRERDFGYKKNKKSKKKSKKNNKRNIYKYK
jgi:hypothetical protein